jgi:diadenylate cyclase
VLEKLGRSGKRLGKAAGRLKPQEHRADSRHADGDSLAFPRRVGALIVFEQKTGLGDIIGTGTRIEGILSGALIENIFEPNTPLHDGAVVVRGSTLIAAAAFCRCRSICPSPASSARGTAPRSASPPFRTGDHRRLRGDGGDFHRAGRQAVRYIDAKALSNVLESLFMQTGGSSAFSWIKRKPSEGSHEHS